MLKGFFALFLDFKKRAVDYNQHCLFHCLPS